jgi:hypothetical protein
MGDGGGIGDFPRARGVRLTRASGEDGPESASSPHAVPPVPPRGGCRPIQAAGSADHHPY